MGKKSKRPQGGGRDEDTDNPGGIGDAGEPAAQADGLAETAQMSRDELDAMAEEGGDAPRKGGALLALAASLFGLWVSYRVTVRHLDLKYGEALEDALCQVNETFNCDNVLNSDYATIFNLPISLPQLANFVVVLLWAVLALVASRRIRQGAASLIFAMGLLSVAVSGFMFYISKTQIGAFCPYCMMLYSSNLAVFIGGWWASGAGFGTSVKRALAALAMVPLVLGSAALWGGSLAAGQAIYEQTKERFIAESLQRQEAAAAERAAQEAEGKKFPTIFPDDPFVGPADAAVTLVEFADFQCGYCKRLSYELHRVKEEYGDSVKFVFKNYPMNKACNPHLRNDHHPFACAAAVAAECAHAQGKFWDYHDLLFKNQHRLRDEDLRYYAEEVGLDLGAWQSCLADPKTMAAIRADMDDAARLEISGTPRTYIAGEEYRGALPAEIIATKLAQALGEGKARVQRDKDALDAARAEAKAAPTTVDVSLGSLSFTIDAFEAAIDDSGAATSAADRDPANQVNWFQAKAACEAAGKRLCSVEEWMGACMGAAPVDDDGDGKFDDDYVEGWEYPYGESYVAGQCWAHGDLDKHAPAKSGLFALCRTPTGIYDLTGNVAEWVGSTPREAVLMGGGYGFEDKAKCNKVQDTYGAGWANRYTGFRCCK